MNNLLKRLFSPLLETRAIKKMRVSKKINKVRHLGICDFTPAAKNKKTRVLFYQYASLTFGGSQKYLQSIAKHINKDDFEAYFMFSRKTPNDRKKYLDNCGVNFIEFTYSERQNKIPNYISDMKPDICEVLEQHNIDVIITFGYGYPEFPVPNITKLPIVYINVFGGINIQENIKHHICMSHLLSNMLMKVMPERNISTIYIQSEIPDDNAAKRGLELRRKLGIKDNEIVFGRIGRADDNTFDPIGIRAFQKAVTRYNNIHFIIMSPPPILEELLNRENIPNVHLLPPSGDEKDIWTFHSAIDVMAHFRVDGETCGLCISESMLCGNPVISHTSRQWNAHHEYLDPSFSFITEVDDLEQYANYLEFFADPENRDKLRLMGQNSKAKAEKLFYVKNNIKAIEKIIKDAVE